MQIKAFAVRHLHVKYRSLLWSELIEVWLKHSAVPPGWSDKLMEPGFRGGLDGTGGVNLACSCHSGKVLASSKSLVVLAYPM